MIKRFPSKAHPSGSKGFEDFRFFFLALLFFTLFLIPVCASAADPTGFQGVAEKVRSDLDAAKTEHKATMERIRVQREALERREREARDRLEKQKTRLADAEQRLSLANAEFEKLKKQASSQEGNLNLLADTVRTHASELIHLVKRFPMTVEEPESLKKLAICADKDRFPGLREIRSLLDIYSQELDAGSRIELRDGPFINEKGKDENGKILFLGGLMATYMSSGGGAAGYLTPGPMTRNLIAAAPPPWEVKENIRSYMKGEAQGIFTDISNGAALTRLAHRISVWQQLLSGGPLVWPILLVGAVALILIVERILFFRRVRADTDGVMLKVTHLFRENRFQSAMEESERLKGRPTGNVLLAGLAERGRSREVIESRLSEAMLKEMPRLERFLPVLKMLAAVSPLLGLLGTVTGMISTFQVITTFGGGDPKLMSGGISEALVTTEVGLAVAVPIVIATALLSLKSKRIMTDMKEKALALTAVLLPQSTHESTGGGV